MSDVEKLKSDEVIKNNILPYTYVLEVSKKWIEKFEKISEPQYDMENFDYCDIREWDRINDLIHYPVSSSSGGCKIAKYKPSYVQVSLEGEKRVNDYVRGNYTIKYLF